MSIPRCLRDQTKFYASKGFHIIDAEPRSGSHWMVRFAEFPDAIVLTKNAGDFRAMHNNVAMFRRLKEKANGTNT